MSEFNLKENPYICVPLGWNLENRGHLGSLYTYLVDHYIKTRSDWKLIGKKRLESKSFGRYHLLLSEAQGRGINYGKLSSYSSMYPGNKILVNYYRGFQCICRKAMMVHTLRDYFHNHKKLSDRSKWFIPETYTIYPSKKEQCEREELYNSVQQQEKDDPNNNYWILKPSDGLKGNRIKITKNLDSIKSHIEGLSHESVAWVASKYLHQPALVEGNRKFDIRCWVLLSQNYEFYVYREGVLRTAACAYTLNDLNDVHTHLSNHCIAETHPDFGKYEPTNELWFDEYDIYLKKTTNNKIGFYQNIFPKIKNVIAQTLQAGKAIMCPDPVTQGFDAFEIFGFDLALDVDYRVWLIEVNSSPAVAEDILPRLSQDLMELIVDQAFTPLCNDNAKKEEKETKNCQNHKRSNGFEKIALSLETKDTV